MDAGPAARRRLARSNDWAIDDSIRSKIAITAQTFAMARTMGNAQGTRFYAEDGLSFAAAVIQFIAVPIIAVLRTTVLPGVHSTAVTRVLRLRRRQRADGGVRASC